MVTPISTGGVFYFYGIFITKEIIMKRTIRLTERELRRLVKTIIQEGYEDDYTASGFDRMGDAAHSSFKSKGFSHRGKDDNEEFFIMFDGEKFYEGDFEIADYNDTGDIPRVEGGKLIIANPAWSA